ncbi:AsmA protein [Vibrio xiamenensis]|uniref:AsmA protein n=2 Tax=Vibrio xiamenensis TaxID=861298 RepID=A0A1G8F8L4_9VIBR|nr:AsmA protein [Vibrio xiamenensis]
MDKGKAMKKLFLFLAGLVVAVIIAITALVLLVNPNQFKPLIVKQAKQQTGLDLVIDGDISWQFFPSLGFELGKTELKNPQGFSEPNLFKVESVGVDVSVMPLLSHKLQIGNVTLDGAEFYLETLKDGHKNIDALTKAQDAQTNTQSSEQSSDAKAPASTDANAEPTESKQAWTIELAGVTINNAMLDINDKQAGSHTKLYDLALNLSEFAFDTWTNASFAAKGQINQQSFAAKGEAGFKLAPGFSQYELRNINLDASYQDPSNQIDSAKFELESFAFDQSNALNYSIKGKAADMTLDLSGKGSVEVDSDMTLAQLKSFSLSGKVNGESLPQSPLNIDMASNIRFDLKQNQLSVELEKLAANDIELDGQANVTLGDIPKIRFGLHSANIDLDALLGSGSSSKTDAQPAQSKATSSTASSSPSSSASAPQEPDLSALKTLDLQGEISIDKFKASGAKLQNVAAKFAVNKGIAKLSSFSANLYQGSVNASATLNANNRPATYTVSKQIKGVQIQPLLVDVADNDILEGTGNITANLKGKGLLVDEIQKNLDGKIDIAFNDGAVHGINVAQLIRKNYAKIKGKSIDDKEGVQKTDFSAVTATLNLAQGIVSTNNLSMQSPLLRVHGEGSANTLNQTLDFLIDTSIVGTLEGQGGKDIDDLKDLTIPINISGPWAKLKYKLVFDDVLKQKANKEIDRGLKKLDEKLGDKIKDEKTKDAVNNLLKGLFN